MREFIKENIEERNTIYSCNCQESLVKEQTELYKSTYEDPKLLKRVINDMKKSIKITGWLGFLLTVLLTLSSFSYAEDLSKSFNDVNNSDWAYKFINSLQSSNIVNGYPDGSFRPNNNVKVNEYIAMAVKTQGYWLEPVNGDWAKPYIDKALELHIIEPNQFTDYNAKITRQSMAVITMNTIYLNEERPTNEYDQYVSNEIKDFKDICGYCAQSVLDAYKMGITTGYSDKTYRGSNFSTRAEATTFISKIINTELRDKSNYDFASAVGAYYWVKENGERVFAETNIYKNGIFKLVDETFYMPVYKGINVTEMFELGKYLNKVTLEMGDQPFYLFSIGQDGFGIYGHKSKTDYMNIFKNYPQYNDQTVMLPTDVELIIGANAYLYSDYPYFISLDKSNYEKYRGFIEKMIQFSFNADAQIVIEKINLTMLTDNRDLVKFGIGGRNVYINNTTNRIEIKYSVKYE